MLVANSNDSKVKSTECKINTSIRKETFTWSQVSFCPLKIDKINVQTFVSLVCLHSLDHTCILYFSVYQVPLATTFKEKQQEKQWNDLPHGQLVSIKSHNNIQRIDIGWNEFFNFFWKLFPQKMFFGVNGIIDETGIWSGCDYKAWLILTHVFGTETIFESQALKKNYEEL